MALVNFTLLSLIVTITLINCYYVIIVNMFSVIKHGRFNGLGESVMRGKDTMWQNVGKTLDKPPVMSH